MCQKGRFWVKIIKNIHYRCNLSKMSSLAQNDRKCWLWVNMAENYGFSENFRKCLFRAKIEKSEFWFKFVINGNFELKLLKRSIVGQNCQEGPFSVKKCWKCRLLIKILVTDNFGKTSSKLIVMGHTHAQTKLPSNIEGPYSIFHIKQYLCVANVDFGSKLSKISSIDQISHKCWFWLTLPKMSNLGKNSRIGHYRVNIVENDDFG